MSEYIDVVHFYNLLNIYEGAKANQCKALFTVYYFFFLIATSVNYIFNSMSVHLFIII